MSLNSDNRGDARDWPATPHEASRFILDQLPSSTTVDSSPGEAERHIRADEPPELIEPRVVEGATFEARAVADPRAPRGQSGFIAFLDGTQSVRVVNQIDGIPIVWARVSAAVRARVNRRLVCWDRRSPSVSGRYYIPFRYVPGLPTALASSSHVVDTACPDHAGKFPSRHPAALMEAAMHKVQNDRERMELDLAEAWCASEQSVLYVDGSIAGSASVSASPLAIGVIKSHRRLYAEGDAFRVLVGLRAGERSSVFRVQSRTRSAVLSWYVRVRAAVGRDALFGLVRVECAEVDDMSHRADEVSRWIIAEGAPLALPDGRWDKMTYGIRDTEEFLRAIS